MSFFSLGGSGRESWRDHMIGQQLSFWVLVVIVLGVLFFWISQIPAKTTVYPQNPREIVWATCLDYISEQYGFSVNFAEDYAQTRISILSDGGYVANISYPNGVDFRCTMQQISEESWHLVNLEMH